VKVTVTARLAFDCAWEVYKSIRADSEGMPLLDPTKVPSDHLWRPDPGPRAEEFIVDFELACRRSLEREDEAHRNLCKLYYLGMLEYPIVKGFLGLKEETWVTWTEEIRESVGKEVMRRGLFPARRYFEERGGAKGRGRKVRPTWKIDGKAPSAHTATE
jgi:hypothetical protein